MLVSTNTTGAELALSAELKLRLPSARCSATCEEVKLSGMQITGGWIHPQSVPISGGRNALGRADRSRIKQQLGKKGRTITGRSGARNTIKHCTSGHFRGGRFGWEV